MKFKEISLIEPKVWIILNQESPQKIYLVTGLLSFWPTWVFKYDALCSYWKYWRWFHKMHVPVLLTFTSIQVDNQTVCGGFLFGIYARLKPKAVQFLSCKKGLNWLLSIWKHGSLDHRWFKDDCNWVFCEVTVFFFHRLSMCLTNRSVCVWLRLSVKPSIQNPKSKATPAGQLWSWKGLRNNEVYSTGSTDSIEWFLFFCQKL